MESENTQEPYRATRLWNEVILAFRTGMPLRRHRHRIRHYDGCFTASDCISWLNCYLKNNPNFGPEVTRQQTIQLLQKFVKCQVIENVPTTVKKPNFQDNSQLYRFVQFSPPKINKKSSIQTLLRTPLASKLGNTYQSDVDKTKNVVLPKHSLEGNCRSKVEGYKENFNNTKKTFLEPVKEQFPECHLVERRLSVEEIENVWKTIVISRLENLLSPFKVDTLIDLREISGRTIMHNVNRVSRTGVVTLIDKTDDIPHWVISAMKCLANWPDASGSGSCLPKYPGFEKDVFKVVKDFFINPKVPLIPDNLRPIFIKGFSSIQHQKYDALNSSSFAYDRVTEASSRALAINNADSVSEQKTSTPILQNNLPLNSSTYQNPSQTFIQSVEGKIILDDSEAMWDNPLTMCYETEFTAASPVTRIISNHLSQSKTRGSLLSLHTVNSHTSVSVDSLSTISACSRATKCSTLGQLQVQNWSSTDRLRDDVFQQEGSDVSLLDTTFKHTSLNDLTNSNNNFETPKCRSLNAISKGFSVNMQKHSFFRRKNCTCIGLQGYGLENRKCESVCDIKDNSHFLENSFIQREDCVENPKDCSRCTLNTDPSTTQAVQVMPSQNYASLESRCHNLEPTYSEECTKDQTNENNFKEAIQVLLLLLPTAHRRQLHLLIRMINKIVKNGKLSLDSRLPTKRYLLETFLPSIMFYNDTPPFNRSTVYQIFTFLVDECELLFQPSTTLKEEAQIRINAMRQKRALEYSYLTNEIPKTCGSGFPIFCKIKYTLDDICTLTYCELVSQQQYQDQTVSASKKALLDLLENIILDANISEKDKRKRLKQFKKNHPEVYSERFPHPFEGTKPRKPLLTRFLSLRM